MAKRKLKLIKEHKGSEVYYVRDSQKVKLTGPTKPLTVYKEGFNGYTEDIDIHKYNEFFSKKGYPPSDASIGTVIPNHESIKPGIEIMLSRKLFRSGASGFYSILDALGLDSSKPAQSHNVDLRRSILENRNKASLKIRKFHNKLYRPLEEDNVREYESQLVYLTSSITKPENFFDLHVLTDKGAKWMDFKHLDLNEAFKKKVRINIDWGIASRMLAILSDPSF